MSGSWAWLLVFAALACTGYRQSEPEVEPLVGVVQRQQVESHDAKWVAAGVGSQVDSEAAIDLGREGQGAELTVYLGTWCSDSRREVSRFWRALDATLGDPLFPVEYIAVDRSKEQPAELLEGVGLAYVPTFVVRRHGVEVGRIVEESPSGIESDLLSLLRGEQTGLITTKTELLAASEPGDEQR